MIRAMASTKRYSPFAYAAIDETGSICAMLVAIKVSTLGRWADPIAARSISYAEPIFLETENGRSGIAQLVQYHDSYMHRRTLFAEVRPFFASPERADPLVLQNYQRYGYFNYELNLQKSTEQLLMGCDRRRRQNLRSCSRRGLIVRDVDPVCGLDDYYAMLEKSYCGSRVPLADRSLFESAFREMPSPMSRLFVAELEGKVVAAACFLVYKRRVVYWYSGTKRLRGLAPTSLILWEAISKFADEGNELFDFAGAGWEGEDYGPGKFKAKFGGSLTNFGRYRKVYAPSKLRCATSAYGFLRGWISPTVERV